MLSWKYSVSVAFPSPSPSLSQGFKSSSMLMLSSIPKLSAYVSSILEVESHETSGICWLMCKLSLSSSKSLSHCTKTGSSQSQSLASWIQFSMKFGVKEIALSTPLVAKLPSPSEDDFSKFSKSDSDDVSLLQERLNVSQQNLDTSSPSFSKSEN